MATVTTEPHSPPLDLPLYRLALDLYHRMRESGLLTPRDRVVLLDGLLVRKRPNGPRHSTAGRRALRCLERVSPQGWHVRVEQPISRLGFQSRSGVSPLSFQFINTLNLFSNFKHKTTDRVSVI